MKNDMKTQIAIISFLYFPIKNFEPEVGQMVTFPRILYKTVWKKFVVITVRRREQERAIKRDLTTWGFSVNHIGRKKRHIDAL